MPKTAAWLGKGEAQENEAPDGVPFEISSWPGQSARSSVQRGVGLKSGTEDRPVHVMLREALPDLWHAGRHVTAGSLTATCNTDGKLGLKSSACEQNTYPQSGAVLGPALCSPIARNGAFPFGDNMARKHARKPIQAHSIY